MTQDVSNRVLSLEDVRWVAAQFGRAPSVHNTQPWRLQWDGERFSVFIDPDRQLSVADPEGRELIISCGAALFNLRTALRQLWCAVRVHRFPDPQVPTLAAVVDVVPADTDVPRVHRMPPGFTRRHTRRADATPIPITVHLAVQLQHAAEAEGAELLFVNEPGPLRTLLRLSHEAEWRSASDDALRRETAAWTPEPGRGFRDGVPVTAYATGSPAGGPGQLARRDFDLGRGIGRLTPETVTTPQLAVLTTAGDHPLDWLRAGEALEAVLTLAAAHWVYAEIHTRAIERPDSRTEIRREIGMHHFPHMLLQFCMAASVYSTPRRPVDAFLDLDAAGTFDDAIGTKDPGVASAACADMGLGPPSGVPATIEEDGRR